MTPEDVAKGALASMRKGPVHYAGPVNQALATTMKFLPRSTAVSFISKNTRKVYE
jgi:short-subunit dehydrogenase